MLSHESTLGIIGLGEIGRELAMRASGFGTRTLYYQRTRVDEATERALNVTYAPLEALLAESDWITIALPNNASTRGLLGREQFARMKPGAVLVNISPAVPSSARRCSRDCRVGGWAASASTCSTRSPAAMTMSSCSSRTPS